MKSDPKQIKAAEREAKLRDEIAVLWAKRTLLDERIEAKQRKIALLRSRFRVGQRVCWIGSIRKGDRRKRRVGQIKKVLSHRGVAFYLIKPDELSSRSVEVWDLKESKLELVRASRNERLTALKAVAGCMPGEEGQAFEKSTREEAERLSDDFKE